MNMRPLFSATVAPLDRALGEGAAYRLEVQALGGELSGINLNSNRWVLLTADADQSDAGNLRELLHENAVGIIADLGERKSVRGESNQQDRRIGRIDFAVNRRIEKIGG
jgi:hypothetical protein